MRTVHLLNDTLVMLDDKVYQYCQCLGRIGMTLKVKKLNGTQKGVDLEDTFKEFILVADLEVFGVETVMQPAKLQIVHQPLQIDCTALKGDDHL